MDAADLFVPGPDDPGVPATSGRPSGASGQRRLTLAVWGIGAGVLALDQATKALAVASLVEGERTDLVGDLLGLQLLYNPGAAFSLGTGYTVVFTVIMVVVIGVVFRSARRLGSRGWALVLGLLVGGAAGNLVDRILRDPGPGRGEVVDFIAYADWFIGNVADVAIVAAAAGIGLLAVRGISLDGTRESQQVAAGDDGA